MSETSLMPEIFRAVCPDCGGERNMYVRAEHKHRWEDGDDRHSVSGILECRILQCAGCGAMVYHRQDQFSENFDVDHDPRTGEPIYVYPWDVDTYPKPNTKSAPNWLWKIQTKDQLLFTILSQVYRAKDEKLTILATVGLRTALDQAMTVLGIDPTKPFSKKLEELRERGRIGITEQQTLDALTEAGNGAAHRGWFPSEEQLDHLCKTLELFIERAFLGLDPEELKKGVPESPFRRRKEATGNAHAPAEGENQKAS